MRKIKAVLYIQLMKKPKTILKNGKKFSNLGDFTAVQSK